MPLPSTPVPDEGMFDGDGLRIHFRAWHSSATPRAVVLIVPGFNAHSAYYSWAADQLVADRLAVYALDLRGRGLSDGERFYVDTFDDYVADVMRLLALAKSKEPAVPIYLLGHRAGGVVASLFTIDHQAELTGFICGSFAYQVPAPEFALVVFKGLSHVAPHAHILHLKNEREPVLLRLGGLGRQDVEVLRRGFPRPAQ